MRCTIIGGPNGSGKSSLYGKIKPPGEFVNADVIARRIDPAKPEAASIAAGREVIERLHVLVQEQRDFVYETTLSSMQSLKLMKEARRAGFDIHLYFVILTNADLNVRRVADRVRRGGHSIPEQTIRRRHRNAFDRLAASIPIAHRCSVYDNTYDVAELLIHIERLTIVESRLRVDERYHADIARAVAMASGLDIDDVYASSRPR